MIEKIKILIVDDEDYKFNYLKIYIRNECSSKYNYDFYYASNFDRAMDFINEDFDIILCDNFLGDPKNFGHNFLSTYRACNGDDCLYFLYSGSSKEVNDNVSKIFQCYSFEEVQLEVFQALGDFNHRQPVVKEAPMPEAQDIDEKKIGFFKQSLTRKLGAVAIIGATATAVISSSAAIDLIDKKLIQPDYERRFKECHKTSELRQRERDKVMLFAVMKVSARQEVTMSKLIMHQADSTYRADSLRIERLMSSLQGDK